MNSRDRAFLERHRSLGKKDERPVRGAATKVEIMARLVRANESAFEIDDGDRRAWVPKSLTTDNQDGTFTMPEWIAKDRGFI